MSLFKKPTQPGTAEKPRISFPAIIVFWTLVIGVLGGWNYYQAHQAAFENARTAALHSFGKDLTFRRWATAHGGVYVPVTERTPPNPHLAHVPERDITTPSGRPLTLINPAYMLRQLHETGDDLYGTRGHITSLKPLRPENAPDAWETEALQSFETGADEQVELQEIDGHLSLRLMRPIVTEAGCLKCHASQGYKVGDLLGGVSIAIPWAPYQSALYALLPGYVFGYGGLWLVGLYFIVISRQRLRLQSEERRQSEEALRLERQRLRQIIAGTRVGTWEWQVPTGETIFNDRWAEIVGYRLEELQPISTETWIKLTHPEDLARSGDLLARHFAGELDYYECEARMQHRSGEWIWVLDRGQVVSWGADGKPLLMAGTHQDITERKRAELAAGELLQRLQKLAAHLPGMIYQYRRRPDGHSYFSYSSDGIQAIYGVTPEAVQKDAAPVFAVLHPEDVERVAAVIDHSATTLTLWHDQYRVNHPSGDTIWVEGHATPERLEDGSIKWHGYIADITHRKMTEEALVQRTLELEERGAELERFNYTVSHDLRSPLVTVKSFLGFLEHDLALGDRTRVERDIEFMRKAADRMGQLLDDLLELSRVGRVINPPEQIAFAELMAELLMLMAGPIAEGSVEVRVQPSALCFFGDRPRLLEVWQNLLDNAIKYRGEQTHPQVELGVEEGPAGVVFYVRDNGMGIDPRYAEKIFGLFEKLDRRSDGSGLGLALVKRVVEGHGGCIWVESAGDNQGSTFRFTLPAALKQGGQSRCAG